MNILPTACREVAPRIALRTRGGRASWQRRLDVQTFLAGKSVESTLGFTALDGLPMGTRPGQLDPGVVLYLMSEKGMSPKEIEHFLYNDCGLKDFPELATIFGSC